MKIVKSSKREIRYIRSFSVNKTFITNMHTIAATKEQSAATFTKGIFANILSFKINGIRMNGRKLIVTVNGPKQLEELDACRGRMEAMINHFSQKLYGVKEQS